MLIPPVLNRYFPSKGFTFIFVRRVNVFVEDIYLGTSKVLFPLRGIKVGTPEGLDSGSSGNTSREEVCVRNLKILKVRDLR